MDTQAHTHTHARTHARTHPRTHPRTHARTHSHTHTHSHTCMYACTHKRHTNTCIVMIIHHLCSKQSHSSMQITIEHYGHRKQVSILGFAHDALVSLYVKLPSCDQMNEWVATIFGSDVSCLYLRCLFYVHQVHLYGLVEGCGCSAMVLISG